MEISQETLAHIRFGYGLSRGAPSDLDAARLLAQVDGADPVAVGPGIEARIAQLAAYGDMRRAAKTGNAKDAEVKEMRKGLRLLAARDFRDALKRAVLSPNGFRERLVAFWADHFTVAAKNQRLAAVVMAFRDEAIRPHIGGKFADMLIAASTHPAMLSYLDQGSSIGPNSPIGRRRGKGLNENLAREILELHTMGVGSGYSQNDVREFAELLTGLHVTRDGFAFNARMAEPGPEAVLGRSYGAQKGRLRDIHAALRDLAVRPETAIHLARKLAVHFIADEPDKALVADLAAAYRDSDGDLSTLYRALLEHPAAWEPKLRKVKQPWDFVVSSLRALGIGAADLDALSPRDLNKGIAEPMMAMGQPPFRAPGPDGWPEDAESWVTPATLAARIEWATAIARHHGTDLDPRAFLNTTLADAAPETLHFAAGGAESKWEGVAIVLASATFNRR